MNLKLDDTTTHRKPETTRRSNRLGAVALLAVCLLSRSGNADTIQLNPGTLSGSINLGSEVVSGGYVYANSSDGLAANTSFQGNNYSLTVAGDRSWSSSVNAYVSTGSGSTATIAIYKGKQVSVPAGQSATQDYSYPSARIHGSVNVNGGTLLSYYVYANAGQNGESYSSSCSFGSGGFSLPMISGYSTFVSGTASVRNGAGQVLSVNFQGRSMQLEAEGAEVNWNIDLNTDSGSLGGHLAFQPETIVARYDVYLNGNGLSSSQSFTTPAANYSFTGLPPGQYQISVYTSFASPYSTLYTTRSVTVSSGQMTTADFDSAAGFAEQNLSISGSRNLSQVSYAIAYAYSYQDSGFAYDYIDPLTGDFDFALTAGQWYFPYFLANFNNNSGTSSLQIQDWDPRQSLQSFVEGETIILPARSVETSSGDIILDVAEAAGQPEVLISGPQISGYRNDAATGKTFYLSSYSWATPVAHPVLAFTGVPGTYDATVSAQVNGSYVVFGHFPLTLSAPLTTPAGPNVSVSPSAAVDLTFANVTSPGITTVSQSAVGPQQPSGFQIFAPGGQRLYYDIKTTATFDGMVEVCLDYIDTDDGSANDISDKQESKMRLLHYDSAAAAWIDITKSQDLINNRICGSTPSFSIFAIGTSADPEITGLSLPATAVLQGETVSLVATFTDADLPDDAHEALIQWGDGQQSVGSVDEATGTVTATHTYIDAGSYTVELSLKDAAGNLASRIGSVVIASRNQPPTAICNSVTVLAGENCMASASINYGSFDPDGDEITVSQSPAGPYRIGTTEVTLTVTDSAGASSSCHAIVTVVDKTSPELVTKPAVVYLDATGHGTVNASDVVASASDSCGSVTINLSKTAFGCEELGVRTVLVSAVDFFGNETVVPATVTVVDNLPPTISCVGDRTVNADPLRCSAIVSGIAPERAADNCSYEISYELSGDTKGTGTGDASGTAFQIGTTTVTYTITDSAGLSAQCSFHVTVLNPMPEVTLQSPANGALYVVGSTVDFSASFTDEGGGTHTGTWMFDNLPQTATIVEPNGATPGTATARYTFTAAGVYSVKLTINDSCQSTEGSSADQIDGLAMLVVVYDPSSGFVTGGGWINSPAGAYVANPGLSGKASYGFVSKYQKGANKPTGDTEFQFQVAGFRFKSTSYDWLVVSGGKAQYKGSGSVNVTGEYGFLLTATDGDATNGGGVDKFRIKIWRKDTSAIVYDNGLGSPDDIDSANPQAVGGGSIVVHK